MAENVVTSMQFTCKLLQNTNLILNHSKHSNTISNGEIETKFDGS